MNHITTTNTCEATNNDWGLRHICALSHRSVFFIIFCFGLLNDYLQLDNVYGRTKATTTNGHHCTRRRLIGWLETHWATGDRALDEEQARSRKK